MVDILISIWDFYQKIPKILPWLIVENISKQIQKIPLWLKNENIFKEILPWLKFGSTFKKIQKYSPG